MHLFSFVPFRGFILSSLFFYLLFAHTQDLAAQAGTVPVYTSITQLQNRIDSGGDTLFVINFWATWCKPCVEELPHFEAFHAKNQSKKIKVLLVSLDFKSQLERRVVPFIQEQKLRSEVILLADPNANAWIAQVNDQWDGAIPATLVTQKGKRYFEQKAFKSVSELELLISHLAK